MEACTNRITENAVGLGQREVKGANNDFLFVGSWFSSNKSAGAATDVGDDFIGLVITNTKGIFKNVIKNMKKYCPGGYYLVLNINPMVLGGRMILAIGCKYNSHKVIYLIPT